VILQKKLDEMHSDIKATVESGHDNVKKNLDIHKLNEDMQEQLAIKVEQTKDLITKLETHELNSDKQIKELQEEL